MNEEFDGVFKFTNASKEDFKVMWNSKEYTFPAESTCPMIMAGFTPEEVQNIRKKFAYKYAQREFWKSKEGISVLKEGSKHFTPATYNEDVLQPYIDQCLSPLPIKPASVKVVPKKKLEFVENGTAIIGQGKSLQSISSDDFADYVPPELGQMSN